MHICFIVYSYEDHLKNPEDLLDAYHSLTGWCEALAQNRCKVSALIRFSQTAHIKRGNIDYYFSKDNFGAQISFWKIPFGLHKKAIEINADVYHGHNMDKVLQHAHLKYQLSGGQSLIVQNHAEMPKKWLRILFQRLLYRKIDAFLFCAKGQEIIWQNYHLIGHRTRLFYTMEASTDFVYKERKLARQSTNMEGQSVFLWVGNLNKNKDPLSVLEAFAIILLNHPFAKLYMIFRFDDLLVEVKRFISENKLLKNAVHLVGEIEHKALEDYYNSADYFLLGSHHEGSGYSLMEAMACGCIPIVTDIFSFRMMTDEGKVGFLWKVGNVPDLERAMRQALEANIEECQRKVLGYFNQQLSYEAIAKQMMAYYEKLFKSL